MQPLRPTIAIYAASGTQLALVTLESGSKLTKDLMQDDFVTLNFTLTEAVRFPRGSWCTIPADADRTMPVRYVVVDEVSPQYDNATGGYRYQMRLDAWYMSWSRYLHSLAPDFGPVQTNFTYTHTVDEHVRLIAERLQSLASQDSSIKVPAAYCLHYLDRTDIFVLAEVGDARVDIDGTTYDATVLPDGESTAVEASVILADGTSPVWQRVSSIAIAESDQADPDTNEATYLLRDSIKMVSYADQDLISAVNAMCAEDAFNCEWWMEDDVMHFGRCEQGTALSLSRGTELATVSRARASQEYGTRLVAFGSGRNVPSRYRKYVPFSATDVTNQPESRTFTLAANTYYKTAAADIQTAAAGEQVVQTFTFSTDEVTVVRSLTATVTISAEVDNATDYGNAQLMEVEVYFGPKDNGGTLMYSTATSETLANEPKTISISSQTCTVTGSSDTQRLYIYVILTGLSDEYGWDDIDYAYVPDLTFSYTIATYQVTEQTLFDANHQITSANFYPAYRKAITFGDTNVSTGNFTLNYAATEQRQQIGTASFYSPLAANKTYTITYRMAFYVEILSQGQSGPISLMTIDIFNLKNFYVGTPQPGLNVIEGAVDITSSTDITAAMAVYVTALVSSGSSVKIYVLDSTKGASIEWNVSSDYYDSVTGKEYLAETPLCRTRISHADERGISDGTWYDCEVTSAGEIKLLEDAFEEGDHFTIEGLREESIQLSWFQDRYPVTTVSSYTRRLMLPESSCPNNYIDSPRIQDDGVTRANEVVEVVKVFDDIYPEQTLQPFAVECYAGTHTLVDDDGAETTEYVRRYALYITKADFPFSDQYIPSGLSLQCIFQTGLLSGCAFELRYAGTVLLDSISDEAGTRFCKFHVLPNTDYGVELPNETLHPQGAYYADRFTDAEAAFVAQTGVPDSLIMINYVPSALTEFGYVAAAEARLETAARAYLDKISLDAAVYTATLANDYSEGLYTAGTGYPGIGQKVALTDDTYFDEPRETRVIGIERALDVPYDGTTIKLGESLRYSRINSIINSIKKS